MPGTIFDVIEQLEAAGEVDAAIAEYGRLIEADEEAPEALMRRAALRRELGQLREAEADLIEASARTPHNPWPLMRLGQLAGASGRNVVDAMHKQAALNLEPHNYELRVNAAAAYTQLNWLDLGYRIAKTLPEGLPDWWAGSRQNAIQRYEARRAETRALLRTRRTAPDWILFVWELCQGLFELGRLRLARRLCEWLMREIPSSFPAFFFCSRIVAREAGPAEAAAFLRSLAWLHRNSSEYPAALAKQLHENGLYEEVLAVTAHSAISDEWEETRYIKCVAMLMLGRHQELRSYCREWLAVSPYSVPPAGFVTAAHFTSGLGAAENKPAPAAAAPFRIVQFWDADDVPADVSETMQSWTRHHPECEHIRFNEAEARGFLDAQYGSGAIELFDLCHHVAMKADYFRIAYLLQEGGIWVDADEVCLRAMPSLLHDAASSELTAPLSGDTPGYLHNFFLGARADSPIMRFAMVDAEQAIRRDIGEGRRPDIWQVTGPGLITRAAAAFLVATPNVAVSEVITIPLQQYRVLARTNGDLAYKRRHNLNWQLA